MYLSLMSSSPEVEEPAVVRAELIGHLASGRATEIRTAAGVSQSDVARSIGASRSTVASREQGRRMPRGELADRYSKLLAALLAVVERNAGGSR